MSTMSEQYGSYLLQITPKGIKKRNSDWSYFTSNIKKDWHRIIGIVRGELAAKVFGKALGNAWLFLEPVILAGLYYFITAVIFRAVGETRHFLFILLAVVYWLWFSRLVNNSPFLIVSYGSVIKQTNFPLYIIFASFTLTETVLCFFAITILIGFLMLYGIYPNTAYVWLPLVMLAQLSVTLPIAMLCSVVGTFIKDLSGVLHAFVSIWWYMSPGIYPVSRIPEKYLKFYLCNPFAHILPAYRDIMLDGQRPDLYPLFVIIVVSSIFSYFTLKLFNYAKYKFFMHV